MASFAPEVIFQIGKFPVTNTVLNTIFVDGFLLVLTYLIRSKLALIPGKFQSVMELIIGGSNGFVENVALGRTKKIFPYFMTFFLFILVANWSGLIPGIMAFGIPHINYDNGEATRHISPFIRPLTSDLNATLALAMTSLVATHAYAIKELGFKEYVSRFLTFIPFLISVFKGKPKFDVSIKEPLNFFIAVITPLVMIFVGLLELVSEFVKAISLSFRLFGNIYAGEVVLHTVQGIFAFVFPIPFLMLEIIVGAIQALVFAMLTMVFMVILSTPHHEESKEVSH